MSAFMQNDDGGCNHKMTARVSVWWTFRRFSRFLNSFRFCDLEASKRHLPFSTIVEAEGSPITNSHSHAKYEDLPIMTFKRPKTKTLFSVLNVQFNLLPNKNTLFSLCSKCNSTFPARHPPKASRTNNHTTNKQGVAAETQGNSEILGPCLIPFLKRKFSHLLFSPRTLSVQHITVQM